MASNNLAPAEQEAVPRTPLLLLAGWLALVVAGCVLAALAHSTKVLPGDLAVSQEIQEPRSANVVLGPLLQLVSIPGYAPWDVILYIAAVAALLMLRRWAAATLMALTATGDAMGATVKLIVARARPTADLVTIARQVTGYSFPSGHVVHYVVFYGAIAYLCYRALRRGRAAGRLTPALLAGVLICSALLVVLVGVSRVYLGAHWPSDAAGGYLLGGAWLALLLTAYRRWIDARWDATLDRFRRGDRSESIIAGRSPGAGIQRRNVPEP